MRELLTAYPSAPAQTKLALQNDLDSMIESSRASGDRFYNDRVVVHEAAVGTAEATLRGDLAADLLKVVAPALDLLAYQQISHANPPIASSLRGSAIEWSRWPPRCEKPAT